MHRKSVYQSLDEFKKRVWERTKKLETLLEQDAEQLQEDMYKHLRVDEPDLHFYLEVVEQTKCASSQRIVKLLEDRCFLNVLYATLISWGMHNFWSQNKGPKLKPFEEFASNLRNSQVSECLKALAGHSIDEFSEIRNNVIKLYNYLNPYKENTGKLKIVGRSKLLHFLLPNLIMPIDRRYVLSYLGLNEIDRIIEYNQITEVEAFLTIQEIIWKFARDHKDKLEKLLDNEWNQTIPKVIDNLIIYYCKKHQDKCR